MNFNSLEYLIFLPVVAGLNRLLKKEYRWFILLSASLYFYMRWNWKLIVLLSLNVLVSYGAAIVIEKCENKKQKDLIFALAVTVCLGILVFFKYADYLAESFVNVINAFGGKAQFSALDLILPMGISFYTFQTLSYVADVKRGTTKAERHLGYYTLFVCFFPQLVAGPIERSGDLLPQLKEARTPTEEDFGIGIRYLASGFIRKCAVADMVGAFVDRAYGNLSECNGLAVFIASALFFVQIYNDFAGYSEIAMGSARLVGVTLSKNFDEPFKSLSFTEFFRRWHITLNRWFTDYLYIPLGGNRKGVARKLFNTMLVFALCGLWHGADHTFLLWGVVAGIMVCIESIFRKPFRRFEDAHPVMRSKGVTAVRHVFMFSVFSLACILFRAPHLSDAYVAFSKLISSPGLSAGGIGTALSVLGIGAQDVFFIASAAAAMCVLPKYVREDRDYGFAKETVLLALGMGAIALCWLYLLSDTGTSAFAYFQF